ncbi:ABC transporter substrate-binding protein [Thalassotalea euphylliae]|uniref:ABC transporter substrate-binding protein n=1 Tax=Thalassotalea euphylliae TaxID=1655234 RepID=UPI0036398E5C
MKTIAMVAFFILVYFLSPPYALSSAPNVTSPSSVELNVAVLFSTKGHRGLFKQVKQKFESSNPNIKVNFHGLLDAEYKQAVSGWLESGEMDVLYWQAGNRLTFLAKNNLIAPLNDMWRDNQWANLFPAQVQDAVRYDGNLYGLPFAFYAWGMVYNHTLLNELEVIRPKNWPELVDYCRELTSKSITPIMIGSDDPWVPAAWFDYIDLRLNGLIFHQQLLRGEIAYTDQRVVEVFEYWKQLIDANCFYKGHQHIDWRSILPPLYRKVAGMALLANFLDSDVPQHFVKDIGFYPFPEITPDLPRYEDIPLDVFIIAKKTKHPKQARAFLNFLAHPDMQDQIAKVLGQSVPKKNPNQDTGHFAKKNYTLLNESAGFAQYFDRDVEQSMVSGSLRVFRNFLSNPDIERATRDLEFLRQQALFNSD